MFKGKKILCIIPARKNSKGIKNKNIQKINGKPLIYFPINASLKSKFIDMTLFSTDSKMYQKLASKFGAETPYLRSKNLSKDSTPSFNVIKDILAKLKKDQIFFDIIVLLEPTSPFTESKDIDNAIKTMINKKFISLVSILETSKYSIDFQFEKLKSNKLKALNTKNVHKRRQDVKKTHILDGSIYISYVNNFIKNRGFLSNKTYGYELSKWKSIEIDDEYDLILSRMIYKLKR